MRVGSAICLFSLIPVTRPREMPLAATPILFAVQQSVEGLLWLSLSRTPTGSGAANLTHLFLLFAEVFWPLYALAVWLIEPSSERRRLMLLGLAIGIGVATYLLTQIVTRPHGAAILDGHLVYVTEYRHPVVVVLVYLAATGLPLVVSSHRAVVALGVIVLAGCAVAYAFYWEAFVSVWCFFAAAASAAIIYHFESARRYRLQVARA